MRPEVSMLIFCYTSAQYVTETLLSIQTLHLTDKNLTRILLLGLYKRGIWSISANNIVIVLLSSTRIEIKNYNFQWKASQKLQTRDNEVEIELIPHIVSSVYPVEKKITCTNLKIINFSSI
jgi:hypothetical protein